MRTIACVCILVLTTGGGLCGQRQSTEDNESARVVALENAWNQAEAHGDSHAVELLLAPSFVYTDDDGRFMDRASFLAEIQRSKHRYEQLTNEDQTVYRHKDVAVVTGIYREKLRVKGKLTVLRGRFTDTWIKDHREWLCIASQTTLIAR
jgi:ketosteroid isomerase-like protein